MNQQEPFLRNAMEVHGDTVYRLALCHLRHAEDAEDVYQEVFLRLLGQSAEGWDAQHQKAWLIRTTLNRCHDLTRFRLRRPMLSLDEVPEQSRAMDSAAAELWEAVSRLPEKLRLAIHLHYGEGYQTEEIAAMLHCPAATVRTRLRRGREQLKNVLGGTNDGTEFV